MTKVPQMLRGYRKLNFYNIRYLQEALGEFWINNKDDKKIITH